MDVFLTIARLPFDKSNIMFLPVGWKATWLMGYSVCKVWSAIGGGITADDIVVINKFATLI